MTDHTRTEKIGGNSICFSGHPSQTGNRYDNIHNIRNNPYNIQNKAISKTYQFVHLYISPFVIIKKS